MKKIAWRWVAVAVVAALAFIVGHLVRSDEPSWSCSGDDLHVVHDEILHDDRPYCSVVIDPGATLYLNGHTLNATWLYDNGRIVAR